MKNGFIIFMLEEGNVYTHAIQPLIHRTYFSTAECGREKLQEICFDTKVFIIHVCMQGYCLLACLQCAQWRVDLLLLLLNTFVQLS